MDRDAHYAHDARYSEPDYLEDGPEEPCEVCDLADCDERHEYYPDEPFEPKCWGERHPWHKAGGCLHHERELTNA